MKDDDDGNGGKASTKWDGTAEGDDHGEGEEDETENRDSDLGSDVSAHIDDDTDERHRRGDESSIYQTSDGSSLMDGDDNTDSN